MTQVLIVAFDGLQPWQITSGWMPNLSAFSKQGVIASNHHAVFPTVTRVNAASMVTGNYPGEHGLVGNTVLFKDFDRRRVFSALEPTLSEVSSKINKVLLTPTLADILNKFGKEYVAVVSGTSGNAYVHNPNADDSGGATIHPDFCLPPDLHSDVVSKFGSWPVLAEPNIGRMSRAVDVLTEYVMPEIQPAVSCLWLSEPDHTQHLHAPGSYESNVALNQADRQFGRVLSWIRANDIETEMDLLVVSDHGHSTVSQSVDMETFLDVAGLSEAISQKHLLIAENGGSALFYVDDERNVRVIVDRLTSSLMDQSWCGPIITALGIEGTFPNELIGLSGFREPAVVVSFGWNSEQNNYGIRGISSSTANSGHGIPGQGMHGSMSSFEIRNVLIARGPSFKRGVVLETPTGNVDLTPTILTTMGISEFDDMDGRPIFEALIDGPGSHEVLWNSETFTAQRENKTGIHRQHVTISTLNDTKYLDVGSAGSFSK